MIHFQQILVPPLQSDMSGLVSTTYIAKSRKDVISRWWYNSADELVFVSHVHEQGKLTVYDVHGKRVMQAVDIVSHPKTVDELYSSGALDVCRQIPPHRIVAALQYPFVVFGLEKSLKSWTGSIVHVACFVTSLCGTSMLTPVMHGKKALQQQLPLFDSVQTAMEFLQSVSHVVPDFEGARLRMTPLFHETRVFLALHAQHNGVFHGNKKILFAGVQYAFTTDAFMSISTSVHESVRLLVDADTCQTLPLVRMRGKNSLAAGRMILYHATTVQNAQHIKNGGFRRSVTLNPMLGPHAVYFTHYTTAAAICKQWFAQDGGGVLIVCEVDVGGMISLRKGQRDVDGSLRFKKGYSIVSAPSNGGLEYAVGNMDSIRILGFENPA